MVALVNLNQVLLRIVDADGALLTTQKRVLGSYVRPRRIPLSPYHFSTSIVAARFRSSLVFERTPEQAPEYKR